LAALSAALLVAGSLAFATLFIDGFAERHMAEDRTVESVGAAFFLLTAIVSARAVAQGRRALCLLIGGLGLLAFLDELSFGERVLRFEAPVIHGVKIDAVHDVLSLSWAAVGDPRTYVALVALTGLAVCASAFLLRHRLGGVRAMLADPATPLLCASATLIAGAQFIDYGFGKHVLRTVLGWDRYQLVRASQFEEAAELMGAVLLLLAALALNARRRDFKATTFKTPDQEF
jgi:hypothetical protein